MIFRELVKIVLSGQLYIDMVFNTSICEWNMEMKSIEMRDTPLDTSIQLTIAGITENKNSRTG